MDNMFNIYPNPAQNYIRINFVKECHNIEVRIIDVHGRRVSAKEFSDQLDVTMEFELVPGVYAFMIKADGQEGVVKVVVE